MLRFTSIEDTKEIDWKLEFKNAIAKKNLLEDYQYIKTSKLQINKELQFVANRQGVFTDLLHNKFGLIIVSDSLLQIINNYITCSFDLYDVVLVDTRNQVINVDRNYTLIHLRERKAVIDMDQSLIAKSKIEGELGFLIKPKFTKLANRECFVRDLDYPFGVYVTNDFHNQCKKIGISGYTVLTR